MMKPIIEWLNDLPDGYRELALANCENPDRMTGSMSEALGYGFEWQWTTEGFLFWKDVYRYYHSTPLPPLPKK